MKTLVVKIGTSTLTLGGDRISRGKIEDLANQLKVLKKEYRIILVSSGAIATAKQFLKSQKSWNDRVTYKQAMSAIGQPKLMQIYSEVFQDFDLNIAQCLLTYKDFDSEKAKKNTLNTLGELIDLGYIPIVNENDTVSIEELDLGDNDKLSAYVATLVSADYLLLASDIDGLYDKNPHLHKDARLISQITDVESIKHFIDEKSGGPGTGGMTSKIEAASICLKAGVEMRIVNGCKENFLVDCLNEKTEYTAVKS